MHIFEADRSTRASSTYRSPPASDFETAVRCPPRDGTALQDSRDAVGSDAIRRALATNDAYRTVQLATDAAGSAVAEARAAGPRADLSAAICELESFTAAVSHELRGPIRHIEGLVALLLEEHAAQLDAQGRNYLDRIHAGTCRMAQLVKDLLGLASTTHHPLERHPVSLSALAEEAVAELRSHAPQRQVDVQIAPGLAATGDARLLRIVFDNLLGNAWKYTSRQPAARIEFADVASAREPVYFVRDNGVGFDPIYAGRLFGAFQRLHAESEFEGSGLGLLTVQRIIRRHDGRIWSEAAVDRGATFYFTLGGVPE